MCCGICCVTYEEQHDLVMFNCTDETENRDQNQKDAAGQNATNYRQIGDDGGCSSIDANTDHQETDQLEEIIDDNAIYTFIHGFDALDYHYIVKVVSSSIFSNYINTYHIENV